jgi:hypothetical protein
MWRRVVEQIRTNVSEEPDASTFMPEDVSNFSFPCLAYYPEDGKIMSPRNVDSYLPDNTINTPARRKLNRRFTQ